MWTAVCVRTRLCRLSFCRSTGWRTIRALRSRPRWRRCRLSRASISGPPRCPSTVVGAQPRPPPPPPPPPRSHNRLTAVTAEAFASALGKNTVLLALRIGFNRLGCAATLGLVQAVEANPSLVELSTENTAGDGIDCDFQARRRRLRAAAVVSTCLCAGASHLGGRSRRYRASKRVRFALDCVSGAPTLETRSQVYAHRNRIPRAGEAHPGSGRHNSKG